MLILNTLTILVQVVFIVFMSLISMNIIRHFTSVTKMVLVAPALFVNHGGGPLPLLGDEEHIGLTNFLRDEVKKHVNFKDLKAIILVTAHWEEGKVTISSSKHHDLYFDYYGFPPESYKYKYDAPGNPELAKQIQKTLSESGIEAKLDPHRGWDHGVFVPMMLMNPAANVPIVQISVLSSQDPSEHYKLGEALYKFRKEGIAIIGSGMSYHNMRAFMYARNQDNVVNEKFDAFLNDACTSSNDKRREQLLMWDAQPQAREAHPPRAAEHFMPLIVIAGAGGKGPGERIFNWDLSNCFRLSGFIWKEE
ncbi:dioxygenase tasH-like [Colias croceus]|uniref:dioxygenase tasH-like n=1 Tax=Colias crocea TaxID=72248 RepID=UPI001E27D607|nr:dioxygenase tasH-like [Colias croceus]